MRRPGLAASLRAGAAAIRGEMPKRAAALDRLAETYARAPRPMWHQVQDLLDEAFQPFDDTYKSVAKDIHLLYVDAGWEPHAEHEEAAELNVVYVCRECWEAPICPTRDYPVSP